LNDSRAALAFEGRAMDTTDRGFVHHWQIAGPLLEQFERDAMRRYSEADRRRDIQALLDVPIISPPSKTSGLVEQQRRFRGLPA
jgi:hypothetical protein